MSKYRFFDPEREPKLVGLSDVLLRKLDLARGLAGVAFVITQGVSRPGSPSLENGAHPKGLAVDIALGDGPGAASRDRLKIVPALVSAGFRRIGVYDRHVHADVDDSLPQDVMWVGVSK